MLKAEHITKQYQIPGGGHTVFDAVSDVSIELGNGGVTAIVGESGSGPSTRRSRNRRSLSERRSGRRRPLLPSRQKAPGPGLIFRWTIR